jgi:hypothetical protein
MNKKAISDIVSTVLIIMIAVAAIGIIGAIVVPTVRNNLGGGSVCNEALADLYIDSVSGFSCVDLTKGILPVQIAKGSALIDYTGATISVISEGNSHMFDISSSFPNSRETFYLNVGKLETIDSIELYPKTLIGKKERVCESSSKIKIPVCELRSEVLLNLVASGENQNLFYDSSSSSSGASSPKIQSKNLPGLVGYWTFDDGDYNSTHVFDVSGNNRHGLRQGGVVIENGVGKFDGIQTGIKIEKIDLVNTGNLNNFSVLGFIKPNSNNDDRIFISNEICGARRWLNFRGNLNGRIQTRLNLEPGINETTLTGNINNSEDSWVFFSWIISNQTVSLYLDSSKDIYRELDHRLCAPGNVWYLGRRGTTNYDRYFNGSMDEIMIFNIPLTESEIKTIYDFFKK